MKNLPTACVLLLTLGLRGATASVGAPKPQDSKVASQASDFKWWDDLALAKAQAFKTRKPLLVVFR